MEFMEFTGKTVEEALLEAAAQLGVPSDQIEYEVMEQGGGGFFGFNNKPAKIRAKKKESTQGYIREFLDNVFSAMNISANIDITQTEEGTCDVELSGREMGVLIGKRGQTLDAIQYLCNLAVNKRCAEHVRIKIDTEDYRRRRRETLENLARNIAHKVKRTRMPVSLEPMNPFERREIHTALQHDPAVTTYSEGEEPYRHVVVAPNKDKQ